MHIFDTTAVRVFADAVAGLQPCLLTGRIEPDQVKLALAQFLDVWPASLADDLEGGPRHFSLEAAIEAIGGEPRGFSALRASDGSGAIVLA